jgi:hypothetical protein
VSPTSLGKAITRRRWLIGPPVAQSWIIFLLLIDHPVTAALVASSGIAGMAVLLAIADNRLHQAHDERDAARTRAGALDAELADANTDPVTGLPVRRLAERHLTHAVGVELTVAVADVDDMHEINNGHGHQLGDDYLAGIAHRLDQITVDGDLLARLGGDARVGRRHPPPPRHQRNPGPGAAQHRHLPAARRRRPPRARLRRPGHVHRQTARQRHRTLRPTPRRPPAAARYPTRDTTPRPAPHHLTPPAAMPDHRQPPAGRGGSAARRSHGSHRRRGRPHRSGYRRHRRHRPPRTASP